MGADAYFTMQGSASDSNAGILFKDNAGTQNSVILYDFDDDYLKFSVLNDAEALRITSGGQVQIPVNATGATSGRLQLGASQQLSIFQDSANAYIANDDFIISNGAVNETLARFRNSGAVDLYHNNSKKFETTSSGVTVTGTISDSMGPLRRLGINAQTGAYTVTTTDAGKLIRINNTGNITIPTGLSPGDMVSIVSHHNSTNTIVQDTGLTMYNTADGSTGNRTLAARGVCTILWSHTDTAYISGSGLT